MKLVRLIFFWYRKSVTKEHEHIFKNTFIKQIINMLASIQLKKIITTLQGGGLIAFPTETVYALAGDASNLSAIRKVFQIKNRPVNQPLSVLLPQHYDLAAWTFECPLIAQRLADYFWPGPLTLIFRKSTSVLSELVGGRDKIGLRVPDHSLAQLILGAFASGLAAPSANLFAHLSPTHSDHVRQAFADKVDMIIDGGHCGIGIESTIVDVTESVPRILRLGALSKKDLQNAVDSEFIDAFSSTSSPCTQRPAVRVIVQDSVQKVVCEYLNQGRTVTVLSRYEACLNHKNLFWLNMPQSAEAYRGVLYQRLHEAKQVQSDHVLLESLPTTAVWADISHFIARRLQTVQAMSSEY